MRRSAVLLAGLVALVVVGLGGWLIWSQTTHYGMRRTLREIRSLPEHAREKVRG